MLLFTSPADRVTKSSVLARDHAHHDAAAQAVDLVFGVLCFARRKLAATAVTAALRQVKAAGYILCHGANLLLSAPVQQHRLTAA